MSEIAALGHSIRVLEPRDAWSVRNLVEDHGEDALSAVLSVYPALRPWRYDPASLDLDEALDGVDVAIVHEWNEPELVRRIGRHRIKGGRYALLFHDTHHRSVTAPAAMASYDLSGYDAVLAFGEVVREIYLASGWARRAFTWHEAADTTVFHPIVGERREGDLVWIGNWGDDERTSELGEFLLGPVAALRLAARVHGVRYPAEGRRALADAGVEYAGWLANFRAPEVFARFLFTVHVPRRPYAARLRGIPTIRPFEALASCIPLVSAPWKDSEGLFRPGTDYLVARDGAEMVRHLRMLRDDAAARSELAENGLATIRARHTCAHRVEELFRIVQSIGSPASLCPPALEGVRT
jgi:spore maturation protein CgeB